MARSIILRSSLIFSTHSDFDKLTFRLQEVPGILGYFFYSMTNHLYILGYSVCAILETLIKRVSCINDYAVEVQYVYPIGY